MSFSDPRQSKRGGGVLVYVNDSIKAEVMTDIAVPPELEVMWLKLSHHKLPRSVPYIVLCAVYILIIPIKYSWANYTNSLVNHGICNKNRFHYRKIFPLAGWYFLPPNPISSSTEAEVHSNAISYVASRAVSGCRCHGGSAWKLEITPQS